MGASRLQFDGAGQAGAKANSFGGVKWRRLSSWAKGHIMQRVTPGEMPHAPSPEYADASTWYECSGLNLVRDWGVRGGVEQLETGALHL